MTPESFTEFYIKWHPQVVRYMGWKTHRNQDAEDLAQQLFTELAGHFDTLRDDTASHYMWKSARSTACSALRRRSPITYDPNPDTTFNTPTTRLSRTVNQLLSVQSEDQAICDNDSVRMRMRTLKPREHRVIAATVLGAFTVNEYALANGISTERVRQIRETGLTRMRVEQCLS